MRSGLFTFGAQRCAGGILTRGWMCGAAVNPASPEDIVRHRVQAPSLRHPNTIPRHRSDAHFPYMFRFRACIFVPGRPQRLLDGPRREKCTRLNDAKIPGVSVSPFP
eukprot:2005675-Pyramimonas_sp.AAC.1